MNVTAQIKSIYQRRQLGQNFFIQEFVATTQYDTEYPQHVIFQCVNENCMDLDKLGIGDIVEIHFTLRGNYGKDGRGPYNKLNAWKIIKDDSI